jgi:antitoxin (DNA-binding transcriptional repressor) of toxin-antitoxin stability system
MMDPVNIHQAKTQLSQLLQVVKQGEEVVIARGDARPDPAQRQLRRPVGWAVRGAAVTRLLNPFQAPGWGWGPVLPLLGF